MTQKLYIIAAGADGPCKIGIATAPSGRLRELQTGHPEALRVWHISECGAAPTLEREMHRYFGAKRLKGEWFSISVDEAMDGLVDICRLASADELLQGAKTIKDLALLSEFIVSRFVEAGDGYPTLTDDDVMEVLRLAALNGYGRESFREYFRGWDARCGGEEDAA